MLTGFDRAVERHCSVNGAEGLSLRHVNKPGLLEECDEFSRHVILGDFKTIEKLNEHKQPSHQNVAGMSPIGDVQLRSRLENPEQLLRCAMLVLPRQVVNK